MAVNAERRSKSVMRRGLVLTLMVALPLYYYSGGFPSLLARNGCIFGLMAGCLDFLFL